ncbi:MFS transporter [Rhodocyclaceae bacterium]
MKISTSAEAENQGRYRRILFSIAFASFMVNVDTHIVNISLPTIAAEFNADTSRVSWVSLSYQLTVTGLLLFFGRMGDKVSIKSLFLFGYGLFTLSSLLCGIVNSLEALVAARALQGVGASVLYALTPAMVPRFLPANMRGPGFGFLATAAALGIMVANPLGGLITGYLSWQWIFLINVPVGIVAMAVCWRVLDEREQVRDARTVDMAGVMLSFLFLVGLTVVLNRGPAYGWTSPFITATLGLVVLALLAFVLRERRTTSPLIDYGLFKNYNLRYANIANFFALAFLGGNNFIIPFYLVLVKGLEPAQAGALLLVYALTFVFVGPIAGRLANRISPRTLCTGALLLGALLALSFSLLLRMDGLYFVIGYFVFFGVVYATFIPSNNNVIMGMAPEGKQGQVSASFRMIGRVGITFGICLFETLFSQQILSAAQATMATLRALPKQTLIDAFSSLYLTGALIMAISALFSWRARTQEK